MSIDKKLDSIISMTTEMKTIYDKLERDGHTHKEEFKKKIKNDINSVLGILSGYTAEVNSFNKNVIKKNRRLHEGPKKGDLATGAGVDAKVIQFKSTITDARSTVSDLIGAAANQLSGERGEEPDRHVSGTGDRHVIDITINNADNTWPMYKRHSPNNDYRAYYTKTTPSTDICRAACAEIESVLDKYEKHVSTKKQSGKGISPALRSWLTDLEDLKFRGGTLRPTSSGTRTFRGKNFHSTYASVRRTNNAECHINAIIVKVRYVQGLESKINDEEAIFQGRIRLLVMCAYRYDTDLRVRVFKLRYTIDDLEEHDILFKHKLP